jgi:hypothetical protein
MGRHISLLVSIGAQFWALLCIFGSIDSHLVILFTGPILLLCYQFLAFFHEAGHAIAAKAVGWRVIVFTVRPLAWRPRYRDLTWVRWRGDKYAGFVSAVPRGADVTAPGRFALLVLAGPLVNLLLGAILVWSSAGWLAPLDGASFSGSLVALGLGIQSLGMGIANLAPHDDNDGALLLRYWRGEGERPGLDALDWLSRLHMDGERLRDYPRWMIERVRATEDPPEGLIRAADIVDIGIMLDSAVVDVATTRVALDRFRTTHGASEWRDSCDAYFTACWERDAVRARAALWQGERSEGMRSMAAAAEAMVAAVEGDGASARARLGEMRAAVKAASPYPDLTFGEIGRQIEGMIEARAAAPPMSLV